MVPSSNDFRSAMGGLPTGVAVVTALSQTGPAGATVNAVSSLSLDPPLILACLDVRSRTLDAVRERGRFAVNVLHRGGEPIARRFASKAAPDEKWAEIGWREEEGVPRLDAVALFASCETWAIHAAGDHEIVIGRVRAIELVPECEPLVFWRGRYGVLASDEFGGS